MQDTGPLNFIWLGVTEQYSFPSSSIKHTHTHIHIYTNTCLHTHTQSHLYTLCTHVPKLIHTKKHTHIYITPFSPTEVRLLH